MTMSKPPAYAESTAALQARDNHGSGVPAFSRRGVALRQLGAMIDARVNKDAGAVQLKFVDVRRRVRET
jgi:hypothetical protein